MKRNLIFFFFLCWFHVALFSQEAKRINIVYGGDFNKDEIKFPGASIFSKDDNQQVQFEHEGIDLWCDIAVYYQKENKIKAFGNVYFQQGDSVKMNSGYAEYDGNTKLILVRDKVQLRNNTMSLDTEELWMDRNTNIAYYNVFGTVRDSVNVLTSNNGRYYLDPKKYEFKSDVKITNPDYLVESARLDYYTVSKNAYMYGPSTITGKEYKIYCERGFYDTKIEKGYGLKNTRIDYNNRIIYGDSVFFDKTLEFASSTNNIKVIDTINKGIIKGHYAEVHKLKDSVFVTKRAVAINEIENDSIYIHGDTLMVTGKPDFRVLRAFRNAKFFKSDLSGKCDSIHSEQKTGITQLIKNPILWSGENQMTGDSIHLLYNLETEKLDSLKVLNNAFIIQKDSLSQNGYNQIKGKNLNGKFVENQLREVDIIKNVELIYYLWNDDNEFIGIDKRECGRMHLTMENNEIDEVTSFNQVDGTIYPDKELPQNARKLRGFIWRGEERPKNKDDIFDEDDNNLVLPKIYGIENPIDIDNPFPAAKEEGLDPTKLPPGVAPAAPGIPVKPSNQKDSLPSNKSTENKPLKIVKKPQ